MQPEKEVEIFVCKECVAHYLTFNMMNLTHFHLGQIEKKENRKSSKEQHKTRLDQDANSFTLNLCPDKTNKQKKN